MSDGPSDDPAEPRLHPDVWPPPLYDSAAPIPNPALKDVDRAAQYALLGKRFLILSVVCAPMLFLPAALYFGYKARALGLREGGDILIMGAVIAAALVVLVILVERIFK